MTDQPGTTFPFNLSDVAADMNRRFGWKEADLGKAMAQLFAAAQTGVQHFGAKGADPALWPAFSASAAEAGEGANPMNLFFGPEEVRKQVASQIAAATGLQQDAISEMMPVAATLAMGKQVRPYLNEPAQEMLDAFLRGFARGRPKPAPTPADVIGEYQKAMMSFWSSFMPPQGEGDAAPDEAEQKGSKDAASQEMEGATADATDADRLVSDWMAMGKDLQANQFKAFEELFQKASDGLKGEKAQE